MSEPWFDLLSAEVAKTNKTVVAAKLGVSRPAISRVMSGSYGADTGKISARVMAVYSVVACPHLGQEISPAECAAHAGRAVPTASPRAVRHWKACQTCPNKPSVKEPS